MDKYPYQWWKAIWCYFHGHDYAAYDIHIDKCLRCNKEVIISGENDFT